MTKRIFTFLMAFLATMSGAVWGQTTIDLSNPQATTGVSIDASSKVIMINNPGSYVVTGSTSEYRLEVVAEGETTITLKDATIDVAANNYVGPLTMRENKTVNVTLIIEGTNLIRSTEGTINALAAITVRDGQSLTIEGTGILRAEGAPGIGHSTESCGDITVESGTVIVRGGTFSIGGVQKPGDGTLPTFTMGDDAFLVVYDPHSANQRFFNITAFGGKETPDGGIYCNIRDDGTTGYIYGDDTEVTLNSPFPSDNFKINLNGKTLTLGEGSYAREDQIDFSNGGTLNAYKVTYNLNTNVGSNTVTIDGDETDYPTLYCGNKTNLLTTPTATNTTAPTWHNFGWIDANNTAITSTPDNVPGSVTNTENQITATSVWVVKQWNTVNVNTGETIDASIQLVYPESAPITISEQTPGTLSTYGAKLDNKKIVPGDEEDKAGDATENAENVTLTIQGHTETITIPFKVNNDAPSFADESVTTVTVSNKEYTGSAVNPIDKVIVNGTDDITTVDVYEVKYKSDNNGSAGEDITAPSAVGTYWVYIAAHSGSTSYQGESEPQKFQITPKTITATAEAFEWTVKEGETPNFTTAQISFSGVIGQESVEATSINGTVTESDYSIPGTYSVTYSFTLGGTNAGNYTCTTATGNLIVSREGTETDPIQPGNPDEDETEIKIEGDDWEWDATLNEGKGGYKKVYDGETYTLKKANLVYVRQKNAENPDNPWIAVPAEAITITSVTPAGNIKNQGSYTVKLSITKSDGLLYSGVVGDITLVITPRPMDVTVKPFTAADLDKTELTTDMVTFESEGTNRGLVTDEPAGVSGTMKIEENPDVAEDGMKHYTVTFSNLKLENNGDNTSFLATNYTPTFKYGGNKITDDGIDVTIGDVEPGEDTDINDGNGDDENNWDYSANQYYEVVYDGKPHGISTVTITTNEGEAEGTVTDATYTTLDGTPISGEKPIDAGYYTANVVISFGDESKTGSFPLHILPRPLGVNFDLSGLTEDYAGETLKAADYANYIEVAGEAISGPLDDETPAISEDGTLKIANTPSANGKYGVTLDGILFVENGDFKPSNYSLTPYINGIPVDDYDKDTGDGSFGGDGDDEGGISFDDDNDGQGGQGTVDIPKYYNIYEDQICEGVTVEFSRDVVREGQSVLVTVKAEEGFDATKLALKFKRALFGYWEDLTLTPTENPNEYIIKNIYTDIYVRAEGAVPTGIESIDGAKVYTKDGSLFVQTPQLENVTIVTITGAIVKSEQQVGLKQYTGLQRGIYVVRVGEQVFKVRN